MKPSKKLLSNKALFVKEQLLYSYAVESSHTFTASKAESTP